MSVTINHQTNSVEPSSGDLSIGGSGNVGIGTSSPSQNLTVGFADNGTDGISFRSSTYANLAKILVQNETSTQNGNLQFYTRSGGDVNEAMRIDSSGHAIIPAGVTLGTSAGTYAAANTLDDYEEGTWAPVIRGSTTNPTVTVIAAHTGGRYVKVGNMVWVSFECRWSAITGGAGNCFISGLPFTRKTTAQPDGDRSTFDFYKVTVPSGGINPIVSVGTGETNLGLSFGRSANTTSTLPVTNLLNANPGFIRASIVYETS